MTPFRFHRPAWPLRHAWSANTFLMVAGLLMAPIVIFAVIGLAHHA